WDICQVGQLGKSSLVCGSIPRLSVADMLMEMASAMPSPNFLRDVNRTPQTHRIMMGRYRLIGCASSKDLRDSLRRYAVKTIMAMALRPRWPRSELTISQPALLSSGTWTHAPGRSLFIELATPRSQRRIVAGMWLMQNLRYPAGI